MKQCPNCGAQAQDRWILCPSCMTDLRIDADKLGPDYYVPPESEPVIANPATPPQQKTVTQPQSSEYTHKFVLFLLFLGGGYLILTSNNMMRILILLLSTVFVYLDAKELGAGMTELKETLDTLTWRADSWALLVLLLWVIGMPLYLIRRRKIFYKSQAAGWNPTSNNKTLIVGVNIIGLILLILLVISYYF